MDRSAESRPVVLVTGAARRIGAVIAGTLHGAGYNLVLHYRHSAAQMAELCAGLEAQRPDSTVALAADLDDLDALQAMATRGADHFGRIDALVNNASTFHATAMGEASAQDWEALFNANARAPLFLAQALAPALRASRGAIVNITDIYAERPLPGHSIYCMSKAALAMLTRSLAVELGPQVRVNAVAPGNMLWSTNPVKAETLEMVQQRTTLGRQGEPQDIADAVLYLLRDAHYSSGATLAVDGGRLLHI